MSKLNFISCDADPLSESEIKKVVKAIGPIPEDYIHFLMETNGGRLGESETVSVALDSKQSRDRATARQFAIVDPDFPPLIATGHFGGRYIRMIEVAGEYQCDIFLMSLDVKNFGAIYTWYYENEKFWDAEDSGELYIPNDENAFLVANSFREFVDKATPDGTDNKKADVSTMEPSVENYAKHGDDCFFTATEFLDKYTVEELDAGWPKDARYPHPAILHASGYGQINMVKYLISRGVNLEDFTVRSSSGLDVCKVLIEAKGNTLALKQELLLSAAGTITATSKPSRQESIIEWLTEIGVQPDFTDTTVTRAWLQCIHQCYSKKVLRYLLTKIDFPVELHKQISDKLHRRFSQALTEDNIMTP